MSEWRLEVIQTLAALKTRADAHEREILLLRNGGKTS